MIQSAEDDVPPRLLQLAVSPQVPERMEAASGLARYAGQQAVDALLHRLLLDEQDTAVTYETAEALLARGDLVGARAVARAVAEADPWDLTAAWIGDAVHNEWRLRHEDMDKGRRLCEALVNSDDDSVRRGAADLLVYLDHGGWPGGPDPDAHQPRRPGLLRRLFRRGRPRRAAE
jgi:hypothetical protein